MRGISSLFLVAALFLLAVALSEVAHSRPLNYRAGSDVLYEVQVRVANACHPNVGSDSQKEMCRNKISPNVTYNAVDSSCDYGTLRYLEEIKLGTLDDMMEDTSDYHDGITLKYIKERVGATVLWLMPNFPNNDVISLPSECDNLGSPYASRDYMHINPKLSRNCILKNKENDNHNDKEDACYANNELKQFIDKAHSLGLRVILDVAFNHFGHRYLYYDIQNFKNYINSGYSADQLEPLLWNFEATFDENQMYPTVFDRNDQAQMAFQDSEFWSRCGQYLCGIDGRSCSGSGSALARFYNMWQVSFPWERARWSACDSSQTLEDIIPAFYLGSNSFDPASSAHEYYTNDWRDVRFLFHHEDNVMHKMEFYRVREYVFRVMNYYLSLGADGFRLDHATDHNGGFSPNEWSYILSKLDYYAAKRGQNQPIYLAEEFEQQMGMSYVSVDMMTEGYVTDMVGKHVIKKNTQHVERVITNTWRFDGRLYVMTGLENHDELRLLDNNGFNIWTGAGFWGIGATLWSTPMILMGQEFGEPWRLAFKQSDFLRSRFIGSQNYNPNGAMLVNFYKSMITSRLDGSNKGLISSPLHFLRTKTGNAVDERIFAMMKWTDDGSNVMFVFHNLWEVDVSQSYFIPPEVANRANIQDNISYILYDVISQRHVNPACINGSQLKWDLFVSMPASVRMQWLRLEQCSFPVLAAANIA